MNSDERASWDSYVEMPDLRAAILAACDEIAADLVDLRAIVQADRLLTDAETRLALCLLDGMQRTSRRAKDATFIRWREIPG